MTGKTKTGNDVSAADIEEVIKRVAKLEDEIKKLRAEKAMMRGE